MDSNVFLSNGRFDSDWAIVVLIAELPNTIQNKNSTSTIVNIIAIIAPRLPVPADRAFPIIINKNISNIAKTIVNGAPLLARVADRIITITQDSLLSFKSINDVKNHLRSNVDRMNMANLYRGDFNVKMPPTVMSSPLPGTSSIIFFLPPKGPSQGCAGTSFSCLKGPRPTVISSPNK